MKSASHRDERELTHPVSEHPDRQPANISHGDGLPHHHTHPSVEGVDSIARPSPSRRIIISPRNRAMRSWARRIASTPRETSGTHDGSKAINADGITTPQTVIRFPMRGLRTLRWRIAPLSPLWMLSGSGQSGREVRTRRKTCHYRLPPQFVSLPPQFVSTVGAVLAPPSRREKRKDDRLHCCALRWREIMRRRRR